MFRKLRKSEKQGTNSETENSECSTTALNKPFNAFFFIS